jgi:ribose transport system substrate-binding protein
VRDPTAGLNLGIEVKTTLFDTIRLNADQVAKDVVVEGFKAFASKNKMDIDSDKFTLVVADTLRMQLELLRDGYAHALVGQRPFEMGEKSMDVLLAIKKAEKVPEIVYTGLDLVTKDNVAKMLR